MTTTSTTSSSASPRYRGFSGALTYGLLVGGIIVFIGLLGGGAIWLITRAVAPAMQMVLRLALVGAVIGMGAALSRWLCGATTDRLLSMRFEKGDVGGLGFLLGLGLAGYLTNHPAVAEQAENSPLAIGQVLEIAGPTLDGGRFDLANHRGKVVLVDFWASWCGPCIAELPNVREVYEKYHGEGFEVVAVSLDFERAALVKFLEAHPEPWPQIFFDEEGKRGFDNPLARRYGINGIPRLLVIDRDGKLVSHNVRGRQIEATVASVLGRPVSFIDRLASAGLQLVAWLFDGVLQSPWWILVLCGLGATFALAIAELAVRRVFPRPTLPAAPG